MMLAKRGQLLKALVISRTFCFCAEDGTATSQLNLQPNLCPPQNLQQQQRRPRPGGGPPPPPGNAGVFADNDDDEPWGGGGVFSGFVFGQ